MKLGADLGKGAVIRAFGDLLAQRSSSAIQRGKTASLMDTFNLGATGLIKPILYMFVRVYVYVCVCKIVYTVQGHMLFY